MRRACVSRLVGTLEAGAGVLGGTGGRLRSAFWMRTSTSRILERYSSSLRLSSPPSELDNRLASPVTTSRMLFSYLSGVPEPKRRSKRARGRISGGLGEEGVRHEMELL